MSQPPWFDRLSDYRRANSIIDGMPLTGQQGTINFIDSSAVEFYSGPQSAAFGRATFSDAYLPTHPVSTSEFGRGSIGLGLSGPISEKLGYAFNAQISEYDGPDDWVTSEGFGIGGNSTEYFSGKLAWAQTETFDMEVRYLNGEADDGRPVDLF